MLSRAGERCPERVRATAQRYYILATNGAAFAAYGLTSAIGPVAGPAVFRPGLAFSTSAGDFALTSAGDVTLTATTGTIPVPEPASLVLLGAGLLGLGLTRCRRMAV